MKLGSIPYDLMFVAHLIAGIITVVVLVTMRRVAPAPSESNPRRNVAARALHVMVVTGAALASSGNTDVSWRHAWVQVGLGCYLAMAIAMEGFVLPTERALSRSDADAASRATRTARYNRALDGVLLCFSIAVIAMLGQFG